MRQPRVGGWSPALAVPLILGLTACSSLPSISYYTFGPPGSGPAGPMPAADSEGLTVAVATLEVDPPYDQDRIVWRRGAESSQVGFYEYHRWAAPPGHLIQLALANGLEGVPGIASAAPAGSSREAGARLVGRVLHLEEVADEGGSTARIAIELELRERGGDLLWSGTLDGEAPGGVAGGGAAGAQAAALLDRAMESVVEGLRRELGAVLGRREASPEGSASP